MDKRTKGIVAVGVLVIAAMIAMVVMFTLTQKRQNVILFSILFQIMVITAMAMSMVVMLMS